MTDSSASVPHQVTDGMLLSAKSLYAFPLISGPAYDPSVVRVGALAELRKLSRHCRWLATYCSSQ